MLGRSLGSKQSFQNIWVQKLLILRIEGAFTKKSLKYKAQVNIFASKLNFKASNRLLIKKYNKKISKWKLLIFKIEVTTEFRKFD